MSSSALMQNGITTAVRRCPVTMQRLPAADLSIRNAGVARASNAPSNECPESSKAYHEELSSMTVLQQHCTFFDKDNDGIIWPLDTLYGFHQIGFNLFLAIVSMCVIHFGFSYVTCPSIFPDPFFRVYTKNIHKAKHGSDSGTYDTEGRFVPQHFEDIFSKYDKHSSGASGASLQPKELACLHKGNRNAVDPFGWSAAVFEFFASWWISDGEIKKEELRGIYDGSVFYQRWEIQKSHENSFWKAVGRYIKVDEAKFDRISRAALVDAKSAKMKKYIGNGEAADAFNLATQDVKTK